MARLLVFVLCASMVTTQRNGNAVKNGGESRGSAELKDFLDAVTCCKVLAPCLGMSLTTFCAREVASG